MARTLAESGISLLIGNLGSGLDSGRGFLLMGLEISSITPKEFFFTFLYVGTITYTVFDLGNIFGDICTLFRKKRFEINFFVQRNASKFAIFLS